MRSSRKIREFCAQSLDPLVGQSRFDFITDFGAQMPMQVIGSLLGIPEEDQETIRDHGECPVAHRGRQAHERSTQDGFVTGEVFDAYIDWRADHPSDDIMTELSTSSSSDETGTRAPAAPRGAARLLECGRRRR